MTGDDDWAAVGGGRRCLLPASVFARFRPDVAGVLGDDSDKANWDILPLSDLNVPREVVDVAGDEAVSARDGLDTAAAAVPCDLCVEEQGEISSLFAT